MTDNTLVLPALKPVYVNLSNLNEALLRFAAERLTPRRGVR